LLIYEGSVEKSEVERFVMDQVAAQLRPFAVELSDVKTRLRSIYRNGDQGDPGLLDDLRDQQKEIHKDVQTILLRQANEDGRALGRSGMTEENDKKMGKRIALLTVVIVVLGFMLALLTFIEGRKTSLLLWPKDRAFNQSERANYAGPRSPY